MNELQALYDSEINFSISTPWDAGFSWKLGDEANGYAATGNAPTLREAVDALVAAATREFPRSRFAGERRTPRN